MGDDVECVWRDAYSGWVLWPVKGVAALSAPSADQAWRVVGASGQPAFQNGWVNSAGGAETVAFYRDALGFVHLRGSVKSGTADAIVFVLPLGYRPLGIIFALSASPADGGSSTAWINASGEVHTNWFGSGNTTGRSLDGFNFFAEQ